MALNCETSTLPRMANTKRTPVEDRFWPKVEVTGFCWNWTAGTVKGYGVIGLGGKQGKQVYSHRWAYEHLVGQIPEGLEIDHLCRNTRCVNPDHHDLVTRAENTRRAHRIRGLSGLCKYGHILDYVRKDGTGRQCSTCNMNRQRARRRATKESA